VRKNTDLALWPRILVSLCSGLFLGINEGVIGGRSTDDTSPVQIAERDNRFQVSEEFSNLRIFVPLLCS
jgi:hypothetical protein